MSGAVIHLHLHDQSVRTNAAACAARTSRVAGIFLVIVSAIMLAAVLRDRSDALLVEPGIEQLKKQLAADHTNEAIKSQIREADQVLRQRYFRRAAFLTHGAWLLLAGAVVLAASSKFASDLSARRICRAGRGRTRDAGTPP